MINNLTNLVYLNKTYIGGSLHDMPKRAQSLDSLDTKRVPVQILPRKALSLESLTNKMSYGISNPLKDSGTKIETKDQMTQTKQHKNFFNIWRFERVLKFSKGDSLTLKGHSRGGEMSGFYIKELKLLLDAGVRTNFEDIKYILITHVHEDHSYELPVIMNHTNKSLYPIQIFTNRQHLFNNFLSSSYNLIKDGKHIKQFYNINQINDGDVFKINTSPRDTYIIKGYKLYHTVDTIGYGIICVIKELKDELKDDQIKLKLFPGRNFVVNPFTPEENRKFKRDKGAIFSKIKKEDKYNLIEQRRIIYLTDTSQEILLNSEIFLYEYIIIECTNFLPIESDIKSATRGRHIHWQNLLPYVLKYTNTNFILIHFSQRYDDETIYDFFEEEKRIHGIKNIYIWLN